MARAQSRDLTKDLNAFFESDVELPRMKVGGKQTIETLVGEEALLFAKYVRNEKREWVPRVSGAIDDSSIDLYVSLS